ncbi:MAG: hypothetical protein JW757_10205 [Anaerolineales bacterium]|nr:hypothetical protein [Anaerolineales bacterium]
MMLKRIPLLMTVVFTALIAVGCSPDPIPNQIPGPTFPPPTKPAAQQPAEQSQPAEEPKEEPVPTARAFNDLTIEPPALVQDSTDLVSGSGNCAVCHTGLSKEGEDLSFDTLWRASMMAHSAKDPYWQASVSTEIKEFPELAEVIADKCASCHMPLAHFDAVSNEEIPLVVGDGYLNPQNPLHDLAADGVSCTSCHQILPDNFGEKDSYSGHYLIDSQNRGFGERISFGPFLVSNGLAQIMLSASGYQSVQSEHITDSDLCGTCHNLYTPYLNSAGEVAGEFPEQTIHLEWENSDFASGACADCHMPRVDNVNLSNLSNTPQEYLRKHTFAGANAFMLKLLQSNAAETGITADEGQMQAAIDRITAQLYAQPNTDIKVNAANIENEILTADVTVSNNNGHKRPASFPSRRVWIHFWVTDGNGTVIFESGAVDERGFIEGNDNDIDAALYEPHYQLIDSPDQVQIYEAIMHNTENEVTTTLLRAAGYLKDNRLLPQGFPLENPPADIAPYGAVTEDDNFIGGGDTIQYVVDVSQYTGPFTLRCELLYQTIAYRWAENLREYGTPESDQFFQYFDSADRAPVVLGIAQYPEE